LAEGGRLAGRRAFVTAAARGIGRASAEAMAAEGAHVVATDIDVDALATLEGAETRRLDARDGPDLAAAVLPGGKVGRSVYCFPTCGQAVAV